MTEQSPVRGSRVGHLRRAGRWAAFAYDVWPLLLMPPLGVVSVVAAVRMLAAREWNDALLTLGLAAFLVGYGSTLLVRHARRAGLLGDGDDAQGA